MKTQSAQHILLSVLTLLVYLSFNAYCLSLAQGDNYKQFQLFSIIGSRPDLAVIVLFTVIATVFGVVNLSPGDSDPLPKALKYGIPLITLLIAWNYCFYNFNFFLNEWHLTDRLLIAVLAIFSIRYPLLLIPLVAEIYLVDYQFNFPLGGSKLLDKSMPLEMLKLWVSFLIASQISRRFKVIPAQSLAVFYFLMLTLFAYFYFHSGLQKMLVSGSIWRWPFENNIIYNLLAIRDRGWLMNAPDWLKAVHHWYFSTLGTPGQMLVLLVEISALFILASRKWLPWFIAGVAGLHLHVFWLNGALFWLWLAVGAMILLSLPHIPKHIFSIRSVALSILLMLLAPMAVKSSKLGWYDSRLDNFFEIEAETNTGANQILSLKSLEPFTLHFQYGNFLSVVDYKNIYAGFIVLDKEVFRQMHSLGPASALALIENTGSNVFRPEMLQNLNNLLDSFLHKAPAAEHINAYLGYVQPPAYWNAHVTDTLQYLMPSELVNIAVYHTCVLREENGARTVLWRRLVTQRRRDY